MTPRTDHDHLTCGKVLRASPAEGLPSAAVLELDCLTQLVHREYVRMGVEKDLFLESHVKNLKFSSKSDDW